ncbi:MAG: sodium:proton antiporter, partial [Candidatus Accumulibacter sp.]|nr:sodium:proton antiporter [Accumulibacter sp.]
MTIASRLLFPLLLLLSPALAWASAGSGERLDLTAHGVGFAALAIFALAYALVMAEEYTHLRKSKP